MIDDGIDEYYLYRTYRLHHFVTKTLPTDFSIFIIHNAHCLRTYAFCILRQYQSALTKRGPVSILQSKVDITYPAYYVYYNDDSITLLYLLQVVFGLRVNICSSIISTYFDGGGRTTARDRPAEKCKSNSTHNTGCNNNDDIIFLL